jgi:predicted DNA-binding protein
MISTLSKGNNMTTLTIALPDEPMQRLRELATEAGVAPEELLQANIERWLTRPQEDFTQAAAYVLKKNAELYRRLAR